MRIYPGSLNPEIKRRCSFHQDKDPKGGHRIDLLRDDRRSHYAVNFTIREQDLFKSGAEIIVNAANSVLQRGAGIDRAIHQAEGTRYAAAYQKLSRVYNRNYPLGYASLISSGNLGTKGITGVIVVAGPQDDVTPTKRNELYSSYYNALLCAHQAGHSSIAFPAISTGIFGFPPGEAAEISTRAVSDFLRDHPDTPITTISIHSYRKKEQEDQTGPAAYQKALNPS